MFIIMKREHVETVHEAVLQVLDHLKRIEENTCDCTKAVHEVAHTIADKRK